MGKHLTKLAHQKRLYILGTRGVPAAHGGFETFAEHLALYLVEQGWSVTVFCQAGERTHRGVDEWHGVTRVSLYGGKSGAVSTVLYDLKAVLRCKKPGLCLSLGYGTAVFFPILSIKGLVNVVNMDGMEWKRAQWPWYTRLWLRVNEKIACKASSYLIADHPEIAAYLQRTRKDGKIATIPYGATKIIEASESALHKYALQAHEYALIIARPEPDNSLLEIVRAFSAQRRNRKLVVLGSLYPSRVVYHRKVISAASNEVIFPGAIYDKETVRALRFYARFYIHGHRVGGTNPSLVEALGAGNAILAHDNVFNRWVAGNAAVYFKDEDSCEKLISVLFKDDNLVEELKCFANKGHRRFAWNTVLGAYEGILKQISGTT